MTYLLKDVKSYENEIKEIKKELKTLPEGYLVRHGSSYYLRLNNVDKGITRNNTLLKQLARKAYLQRRLEHLEANLSSTRQLTKYQSEDMSEIIHELSSAYQTLPFFYFFHPGIQDSIEQNKNTQQKVFRPEELIYYTNSGIRVRSKSERTIADMLDRYKIPFNYETAIVLNNVVLHPDFTIHRPIDGKVFLWEHFGIMSDEKYRNNAIEKITLYIRYGFYPSSNLICTYEQDLQKPDHLLKIIESFILSN